MADDSYLEKRIQDETAKITVDSYQKTASLGGWAGGGRTLWAISAIGAVAGAGIGLVAPFFPLIVGASSLAIAAAAIPASVATFAAVGMGMGFSGGLVLGRISGSAAAVAEENERRMKEWTVKQILLENPNAKIVHETSKGDWPEDNGNGKKSFWKKLKDTYLTYVNPRVGLAMTAIGIVGGLIMAAAFLATGGAAGGIIPALGTITGLGEAAAAPAALTAYSAGVMGTFGALWFLNFPKITAETTHFFGNIINGKLLGREWGPKKELAKVMDISQEATESREAPPVNDMAHIEAKFSVKAKIPAATFQELVGRPDAGADLSRS